MTDLDVAIIGGGISGLAVADGLTGAGRTAQVFEARHRLGGRIHSIDVPDGRADLGPTWFWPGEHRVAKLAQAFDLRVHEQWTAGSALFATNGAIHRVPAPSTQRSYRLSNGADGLVNGLAERLPADTVHLNTPVTGVAPGQDLLTLELGDSRVTASTVVVALPPSLAIHSGIIRREDLEPAIADVATAMPVWMGSITKAVAVYPKPFWRDLGFSGQVLAPGSAFTEIHDMSGPDGTPAMLFGFADTQRRNGPIGREVFIDQLTDLFGAAAAAPLDVRTVDWSTETFTTTPAANGNDDYRLFGSPMFQQATWQGRLHWTSTETATTAPGHIEGALAAAERTVHTLTKT